MDEITLINLLNKLCDRERLTWKIGCKYQDGMDHSILQISILNQESGGEQTRIVFRIETGQVLFGHHKGVIKFSSSTKVIDALLDIMIFEDAAMSCSAN